MIVLALFFLKLYWLFGVFVFLYRFEVYFSSSVKNVIGILIEIPLDLYIALGSMVILKILNLLTHEQRISFHLFVLFLIFYFILFFFCF